MSVGERVADHHLFDAGDDPHGVSFLLVMKGPPPSGGQERSSSMLSGYALCRHWLMAAFSSLGSSMKSYSSQGCIST